MGFQPEAQEVLYNTQLQLLSWITHTIGKLNTAETRSRGRLDPRFMLSNVSSAVIEEDWPPWRQPPQPSATLLYKAAIDVSGATTFPLAGNYLRPSRHEAPTRWQR